MNADIRARLERRLSLATWNDGALDPVGEFVPSDVRAALAHIDALSAEVERLTTALAALQDEKASIELKELRDAAR